MIELDKDNSIKKAKTINTVPTFLFVLILTFNEKY
jgi:hypothetical protein